MAVYILIVENDLYKLSLILKYFLKAKWYYGGKKLAKLQPIIITYGVTLKKSNITTFSFRDSLNQL